MQVPVPDGLVAIALYPFLTALCCGLRSALFVIEQCIRAVAALTRTRRMRVADFWRQLGTATSNDNSVTHDRPHACPLCDLHATEFFEIQKENGLASDTDVYAPSA